MNTAQCGTPSGYNRHLHRKEPTCTACRKAHTAANVRSNAARTYAMKETAKEHPETYRVHRLRYLNHH